MPHANPRTAGYSEFCQWVIDTYTNEQARTPTNVTSLLKLIIYPADIPEGFVPAVLKNKVASNSNGRTYRIAAGVDVRPGDPDRRVRSLLEAIVKENIPVTISGFICPFFTRTPTPRSQSKKDTFVTAMATRFQQLLFMSAIAKLSRFSSQLKNRSLTITSSASKKRKHSDTASHSSTTRITTRMIVLLFSGSKDSAALKPLRDLATPFRRLCEVGILSSMISASIPSSR